MTRRGTVIRHGIMVSESVAKMKQEHKLVWIALLMCSDDWGRLSDKPAKISMRCPAFNLPFDLVHDAVEAFVDDDLIIRYTGRLPDGNHEITILQLASWEEHQKWLKSRDYPEYPDVEGNFEKTTNPLALYKEKEKKQKKKKAKGKLKDKEKEKVRTVTNRSPSGEDADKKTHHQKVITDCYQLNYVEYFNDEPKWNFPADGKHIKDILKTFTVEEITSAIDFMFRNKDTWWTENLGVFMSITTSKLISKALSLISKPKPVENPF